MTDIRVERGMTGGELPFGVPDLPDVFFEAVRRRFSLDGSGRMLALWRGAGSFLPFAEDFESVLLVDPEPGRLADSMWEAERLGIENTVFLEGGREVLHPRMGRFRLIIVQAPFLRKDRTRILSFLAGMTEPQGGVVIGDVYRCGPLADWQKAVLEVLRERVGRGGLSGSYPNLSAVGDGQSLPFRNTANCTYRWTQKRTIGQAVVDILSVWPPPFNERAGLEEALRAALRQAEPSGVLEERLKLAAIFAWNGTDAGKRSAGGNGC